MGAFAPDEGLGVVPEQAVVDCALQIIDAGAAPPSDAPRGDFGKEAFGEIQPGRTGRRKCSLKRGCLSSQAFTSGVLCVAWLSGTRCISRLPGTARSMRRRNLRNSLALWRGMQSPTEHAGCHVERGEQRRDAVALVIAGHGCGAAFLQRQAGLGAVKCLYLRSPVLSNRWRPRRAPLRGRADRGKAPRCL